MRSSVIYCTGSDQVEVLYDDGVKHVTSIASVRKRVCEVCDCI